MPPDPRAPPVAIGSVLAGKYRVERVIGEGGMGIVVAATHLQLESLVALKFILEDRGHAAARFVREARSAVRLKSEHVARVSDVGTLENGMPYMVMEYLEGRDLHGLLSAGPLPIADAVGYVVQACEAIAEAHALGIVHRDLKPHNLFLTQGVGGRPKVKVLDFGISKTVGLDVALTRSAEIVGTPSYMAPEQLRAAKDVDRRADIWALGAVLYELLTGKLPFEAESLPELCSKVFTEAPLPPSAHRPELPQALNDAVVRCLSRSPGDRFADVGELVSALAPFTPEWAPAHAALEVSKPSGSAPRAIISLPAGALAASDAAWSETEIAGGTRSPWKMPLFAVAATVAVAGLVAWAFRMGAAGAPHPEEPLPGRSPASAASAAAPDPPAVPVAASVATPRPQPAAAAPAPPSADPAPVPPASASIPAAPRKPARPRPPAPDAVKPAADDPYNMR